MMAWTTGFNIMPTPKFKIGDAVEILNTYEYTSKGMQGIVKHIYHSWSTAQDMRWLYAVEFSKEFYGGSTCPAYDKQTSHGQEIQIVPCQKNRGYWVREQYLTVSGPPKDGIDNWI